MPDHTPPLGHPALTPAYDAALRLFTREDRWRARLLDQIDPRPGDRILDVGCGTGSLAIAIKGREPGATVIGIDPDRAALDVADRKRAAAGLDVKFLHGGLTDEIAKPLRPLDKIVCSLVLHQTPLKEKRRLLEQSRHLLANGGELHIADYDRQRGLMRLLFRLTVQALDGVEDTEPHVRGILHELLLRGGFRSVEDTGSVATLTGRIAILKAQRD